MKVQINEIKRMQQLAGIIKEAEENQNLSSPGKKILELIQTYVDTYTDDNISAEAALEKIDEIFPYGLPDNYGSSPDKRMVELIKMYADNYSDGGMSAEAALLKIDKLLQNKLDDYDKAFMAGEEDLYENKSPDLEVKWTQEYLNNEKNDPYFYTEKGLASDFKMMGDQKVKEIVGYFEDEDGDEDEKVIGYIYSKSNKDIETEYNEDDFDNAFTSAL
jgi:hypothetical protein